MDSDRHHLTTWDRLRAGSVSRRDMLRMLGATGVATVALTRAGGIRAFAQGATPPASPAPPPPPTTGPRPDGTNLWHVKVASMDMTYGIDIQSFLPKEITINAGDAIWFEFLPMGDFHTVTFLSGQPAPPLLMPDTSMAATPAALAPGEAAPPPTLVFNPQIVWPAGGTTYDGTGYLNSGLDVLMQPGTYFVLTFSKPGTYDYTCMPHIAVMHGKVTVQEKGAALPYKQGDYDAMANDQVGALGAATKDEIAKYSNATTTARPDGTTFWDATVGVGGASMGRGQRILPGNLEVKVGDTVRWTNRAIGEPHTVTFVSGGKVPDAEIVEPQSSGPPRIIFPNDVLLPAGGPVYSGTGYFNSGLLGQGFSNFESYELTFVAPGDYIYFCLLHGSPTSGMTAKIKVSPRS